MQKVLLFVDRVSVWIGRRLPSASPVDAAGLLGGLLPLRAQPAPLLGFRCHDLLLRHPLHDGRGLHAGPERSRARRRALRLLRAAHAGGPRSAPVHRVLHARRDRADLRRLLLRRRVLGIDEHSNVTYEGPPVYPFKSVIPFAGPSSCCRASSRSCAASSACERANGRRGRLTSWKWIVDKLKEYVDEGQGRGHREARRSARRARQDDMKNIAKSCGSASRLMAAIIIAILVPCRGQYH